MIATPQTVPNFSSTCVREPEGGEVQTHDQVSLKLCAGASRRFESHYCLGHGKDVHPVKSL